GRDANTTELLQALGRAASFRVERLESPECVARRQVGRRWRKVRCAALVSGNAGPEHQQDRPGVGAFATCLPRSATWRANRPALERSTRDVAGLASVMLPVSRLNPRAACMGNPPFTGWIA